MSTISKKPNFIIIGSMKSGTTTLHEDLDRHPDIFMASWKEPGYFVGPDFGGPTHLPLPAAKSAEYDQIFAGVKPGQIFGESSTHYTKSPKLQDAAKNIFETLGPDVKLIYVMREPAKRSVSQYMHEFQHGECDIPSLSEAVDTYPHIVDVSRYAMQLKPFQDLFPAENILCLKFENMVKDRQGYVEKVLKFLDVDVSKMPRLDEVPARNTAQDRRSWNGWARKLRAWPFFQTRIEPYIPHGILKFLKKFVTKAPREIVIGGDRTEIENRIRQKLSADDIALYEAAS
jgi:hypothetical protein